MGDVVFLTGPQAYILRSEGNGLWYNPATGEYLRHLGENQYQVVSSPYYVEPSWMTKWLAMDEASRPRPVWGQSDTAVLLGEFNIKGATMEIGGNKCHLCGGNLLYNETSRTFTKKNTKVEHHVAYDCGTSVFQTWKEDAMGPKDEKTKVHAECLLHCCL